MVGTIAYSFAGIDCDIVPADRPCCGSKNRLCPIAAVENQIILSGFPGTSCELFSHWLLVRTYRTLVANNRKSTHEDADEKFRLGSLHGGRVARPCVLPLIELELHMRIAFFGPSPPPVVLYVAAGALLAPPLLVLISARLLVFSARIASIEGRGLWKAVGIVLLSLPLTILVMGLFSLIPFIGFLLGIIADFFLTSLVIMAIFEASYGRSLLTHLLHRLFLFLLAALIAVAVILTLLAFGSVRLGAANVQSNAQVRLVEPQDDSTLQTLDLYRVDTGRCSTTSEGLAAMHDQLRGLANRATWDGPYCNHELSDDPWGTPLALRIAG